MKKYNPERPLISIHIPKCAGTSFRKVLKSWFGRRLFLHYYNEQRNKPPKKYRTYKLFNRKLLRPGLCIHGHFNGKRGHGAEDYYPELDQYITVLRDPFQVHLSNYFYAKTQGDNLLWAGKPSDIVFNNYGIENYLSEKKKSFILNFLPAGISLNNYRQILEEKFIYVGIAEDLQRSVEQLAIRLGFPPVKTQFQNVSPRKEGIPDGAREEFIRNNPLEMALYEYALENYKGVHT